MLKRLDVSGMSFDRLVSCEWLCVNNLGGYASSTIPSLNSRKYHGLLVAAMSPPVRRMVLLSRVEEVVRFEGWPLALGCNEYPDAIHPEGYRLLRAFSAEPFPRWAYQGDGWTLQKELCLLKGRNTVCLTYTLLGGGKTLTLELSPLFALRPIHELMYQWNGRMAAEALPDGGRRIPATSRTPEVFFSHDGIFEDKPNWYFNTIYRREQQRGYAGLEDLWTPGLVRQQLMPGQSLHFVCSTDPIELERTMADCDEQNARAAMGVASHEIVRLESSSMAQPADEIGLLLRRAAEEFVVELPRESSDEPRVSVVAQYPWSPPAGRSALIALRGLLLATGRFAEAKALLLSFTLQLQNGLMPSEQPEDGGAPQYHGVDVSLWFANAVHHYWLATGDRPTAEKLLQAIVQIIDAYRAGTDLGVSVDAEGLLSSQAVGIGATWMDAKAGGWVLTPRQGKAVEVNALWFNALCVAATLAEQLGRADLAGPLKEFAGTVKASFNTRFWNNDAGCCFDVVADQSRDASIRPNQIFAVSLPFPALSADRHVELMNKVRADLLTPFGLRTLSPNDAGYQGRYAGNVVQRDRALHGGSVHPWLLGAYVDAHLRVFGQSNESREAARKLLQPSIDHLRGDGLGQLCEVFDGDPPHAPGGAIASALGVAELLRTYELTTKGESAPAQTGMDVSHAAERAAPLTPH